jgi:hypothetical protein
MKIRWIFRSNQNRTARENGRFQKNHWEES